jgi:hypothetical protein
MVLPLEKVFAILGGDCAANFLFRRGKGKPLLFRPMLNIG